MTSVFLVSSKANEDRNSKHFSLFSVVTFQNTECTSDSSLTGGTTDGTCYTNTECTDKSGTQSGNCASGFGVCCVFLNNAAAAASTISENRTRIRNAEFPSTVAAATLTTIVYTVNKMSSDICQLRLDFTTFVIAGPANTQENIGTDAGSHCQDQFDITTSAISTWSEGNTARLCGKLTGEHLYVELSPTATDTATLTLVTAVAPIPSVALRSWDIKISQIECFATYRAPPGCQRYFTSDYGKIISYNFAKVGTTAPGAALQNAGIELALQRINTCIRRSKGMCCVEYMLCTVYDGIALTDETQTSIDNLGGIADYNEAWTIDLNGYPYIIGVTAGGQPNAGMVDAQCVSDYVEIPSSWSAACGSGHSSARSQINTRYCGGRLGLNGQYATPALTASSAVCDCSEPFVVRHSSDDANDKGGIGGLAIINFYIIGIAPRGFCMDFKQVTCWQ